jgi:DNA-binding transcriptional LysR family regulator
LPAYLEESGHPRSPLAGFAIADLPKYLVEVDLREGRLVSVLPRFIINERSIFALFAPSPFVPAKVRAFVEALQRGFRRGS